MPSKRIECAHCLRPKGHCLCHALTHLNSNYQTLIWQHPDESQQRFKSAHFAPLQLANCKLMQNETLDPKLIDSDSTALIYLSENSQEWSQAPHSQFKTLLFLDGTWNKTKKLFHLNPWLQKIPQFHLDGNLRPSKLSPLRRAQTSEQLSTLEAIALALEIASADQSFARMTLVLDEWVKDQKKYGP